MTRVLVNGELKEDQRKNGARLKLDVKDWIKIGCIIGGFIFGYATLYATVNTNKEVNDKQEEKIETVLKVSTVNQTEQKYLKTEISEVKQTTKEIQVEQNVMHRKIDKLLSNGN